MGASSSALPRQQPRNSRLCGRVSSAVTQSHHVRGKTLIAAAHTRCKAAPISHGILMRSKARIQRDAAETASERAQMAAHGAGQATAGSTKGSAHNNACTLSTGDKSSVAMIHRLNRYETSMLCNMQAVTASAGSCRDDAVVDLKLESCTAATSVPRPRSCMAQSEAVNNVFETVPSLQQHAGGRTLVAAPLQPTFRWFLQVRFVMLRAALPDGRRGI